MKKRQEKMIEKIVEKVIKKIESMKKNDRSNLDKIRELTKVLDKKFREEERLHLDNPNYESLSGLTA